MPPVPGPDLDTRLLRFRSQPGSEDAARLATDLLASNRLDEVVEITKVGLAAQPDDADLLVLSARADFGAGRLTEAQATLLKAARVAGTRKEPFRWLGEVLLKRGDPARAAKVLERAKQIDPNDRAVVALHQRAERLATIAEKGHEASVVAPFPKGALPAAKTPPEERTVVRADLTAALAEEASKHALAPIGDHVEDEDEVTMVASSPELRKAMQARMPAAIPASAVPPADLRPLPPKKPSAAPGPNKPQTPIKAPPPASPLGLPPPARVPAELLPPFGAASPFDPPAKPIAPPSAPLAVPAVPAAAAVAPAAAPREAPPIAPVALAPFAAAGPSAPAVPVSKEPPYVPAADPGFDEPLPDLPPGFDGAPTDFAPSEEDGPPPEPEADLLVGETAGQGEPVDDLLAMLQREGLFEPPTGEAASWASGKEARPERTRVGAWLGGAWIVMLLLAGGGYYGWTVYVEERHAESDRLIEQARTEALAGDHQRLVDAERHLREARELNARDVANPTLLLFVQAQMALEDGAFEVGFLAPAIARAERETTSSPFLDTARAVVSLGGGDVAAAQSSVDAALTAAPEDASILYLAGRLEQRLGDEDALTHLEAAVAAEPRLIAAAIALAEARNDEGRQEDAITLLDGVLTADGEHLRALLWRAYLTAGESEIDPALAQLTGLEPRLEHGAPTDHVLFQLARAHLLRRRGDHEGAVAAVDAALGAGAEEPRLLALAARAARAEGRFVQAERAATEAVRRSPASTDFRKLLASIYLDRRNGDAAMRTLGELSADDPEVLTMTAQAALLVGSVGAAAGAAQAIDAWLSAHEDASVELRALRVRLELAAADDPTAAYASAQTLARDNPGDPVAAMALGEAALRTYHPDVALEALGTVVASAPENADGHWLLARARRMSGDGVGARSSFERAIALRPEHHEARIALGGLLLDLGEYEAADALYVELARSGASLGGSPLSRTGRIGRVEALIGLGRLDDAGVQLEGLRGADAETPDARVARTHLAIARGQFGEALTAIRPLTEGESPAASALALYGEALIGARQAAAAATARDRALEIDAGLPEALLSRASAYLDDDEARDASELLGRARTSLETRIRPPALRARLAVLNGRVQLDGRDEAEAAETLRTASEMPGCPPEAFYFLGRALEEDDETAARGAFERYLELAAEGRYASEARRAIR